MQIAVVSGTTSTGLVQSIAACLGLTVLDTRVQHFPDGELGVEVDQRVRGQDVYVVQSTRPPDVADSLLGLLLTIDALHRAGSGRISAVIPYLWYARQDRQVTGLEAVGGRLVADTLGATAASRIVVLELHSSCVEGFLSIPVENISTAEVLAGATRRARVEVVVAPDMGAAKLAEHYAALLGLPVAIVHKTRVTGSEVRAHALVGDVRGRTPLIVDDMISTGGTAVQAVNALVEAGCRTPVYMTATHGLFVGPALERLSSVPLQHLWLTNSIAVDDAGGLPVEYVDVGPLLAEVIGRLHDDEGVADLRVHR